MQEPWKKAKEEYQNQPLPPQLDMRVKQAIAGAESPLGVEGLDQFCGRGSLFYPDDARVAGICAECGEFAGDRRISADRDGRADR